MITSSKEEASSSAASRWEYDVFLNFRGEDTRTNFTDHLYTALKQKDINTFRDDEGLKKGKPISELFKAIEESRLAVIVFSKNYVDSKWCLDELAKIVECMEETGLIVLPVFYHIDPSDVRNQTGTFAKAFVEEMPSKQEICSMEKEQTWRVALTKVGSLSGWHIPQDRHESECIHQIVKDILLKLNDKTKGDLLLAPKLVGQAFQRNLDKIWDGLMKVDVLSIGIHGMRGVGKTTLAMHIHNRLQKLDSFNVCWVTVSQDFSIKKLQNDIAKTINMDLSNEDDEKKRAAKLAQALRGMKLVLILDDVWKYFSLQKVGILVEVNGCKLILTTRFSDVCQKMGCQENVRVVPLNEEEAWNLFMEKFGHDITLPLEVRNIARSIAKECAGLPHKIITVARSMRAVKPDIHRWRNALEELNDSEVGLVSYCCLKVPKLQECFLNCSLYPKDWNNETELLRECLIDEGLKERKQNRQPEFDKGHAMLNVSSSTMSSNSKSIPITVFIFDIIAFGLAVGAEQSSTPKICRPTDMYYCDYKSDNNAKIFGAGAFLFLLASQALIMVATRCFCCGKRLSRGGSRAWAIIVFIMCWLFFLIAEICLYAGSVRDDYHIDVMGMHAVFVSKDIPSCSTLRKKVFGAGAAFIFFTTIVSEFYYVCYSMARESFKRYGTYPGVVGMGTYK